MEWTDEGIQSSKNLIHRIERYFEKKQSSFSNEATKSIEKFAFEMENNICNFSLNKCVANIYTLFNFLEKNKIYLSNHKLSEKILICLYPIIPRISKSIYKKLFNVEISKVVWPSLDKSLLKNDKIILPIQIMGKLITTIETKKTTIKVILWNIYIKLKKFVINLLIRKLLK